MRKKLEPPETETTVIPVVHEQVKVAKRRRRSGVMRITKTVHEREDIADEPLREEEVAVERVPVNRFVNGPVPVREEEGVTIVPVLEEVMVVEKRLLLKEELHIRKQTRTVRKPQKVVLRKEVAVVEHRKDEDEKQ